MLRGHEVLKCNKSPEGGKRKKKKEKRKIKNLDGWVTTPDPRKPRAAIEKS
jgi:hypothetical protein